MNRFLRFAPLALFAVALTVRLIGLSWGLPSSTRWYSYHPDELQTVAAVASLDLFNGDWNPNFFNYPSAFLYATYLVHLFASTFGLTQEISNANAIWALPHDIIWCARLVSATLGALTAAVVFGIAREIGGARLGLLAGTVMAFAPGHVQHSHFATVDVAATFWVALSLWLSLRALSSQKPSRDLLLAGLCAGLAAATKYNGIVVLVAPLVTVFSIEYSIEYSNEYSKSRKWKFAGGVFLCAVVGFLLGCPYALLSPREFWGDGVNTGFAYELLVHPRQGSGDLFVETGNGWLYHAFFNLPFVLTAPIALASAIGLISAYQFKTQNSKFKTLRPLIAFALLYFVSIGTSQVRFMRYVLPLVPALCVFVALSSKIPLKSLSPKLRVLGAAFLLFFAIVGSLNVVWPFTQTDPRDQAVAWLDQQPDTPPITVGLADAQNPLWFTTPPLWPQNTPPGTGRNLGNVRRNTRYDLRPLGIDAAQLQAQKPQYFVWSEFQWRERERLRDEELTKFRAALNIEYSNTEFRNAAPFGLPSRNFVPHDFLYSHPRVEIWKRKEQ